MLKRKTSQKGSALIYILIAIALLAALTAVFMDSSSQQTTSQNTVNVVTELSSQINFIRSAIDECTLTYPAGDTSMSVDPVGGVAGLYPQRPYPLMPVNTYLTSPAVGVSLVKDIRCPGNPGNSSNHVKIFGGSSGKFLPRAPNLFDEWSYYNDVDGVFIWTATNKTDAFLDNALQKLDAQFSKCEMQYINNTSGVAVNAVSAGTWNCPATTKCIMVKISTTGTTVYPGETGCP